MTSSLVPSLIAFLGVIALIPVALWVMKRAQSLRPGAGGPLAIVAALSTGPRERIGGQRDEQRDGPHELALSTGASGRSRPRCLSCAS